MLNPGVISDALVTSFQTITDLVTALGGNRAAIFAYHYEFASDDRLSLAINSMPSPSMMIVFDGTFGGNFDGSTLWRHKFCIYVRMSNAADGGVGYETLWSLIVNGHVNGTSQNIRSINVIPEVDLMDTPSIIPVVDEDQNQFFKVTVTIPEIGDN